MTTPAPKTSRSTEITDTSPTCEDVGRFILRLSLHVPPCFFPNVKRDSQSCDTGPSLWCQTKMRSRCERKNTVYLHTFKLYGFLYFLGNKDALVDLNALRLTYLIRFNVYILWCALLNCCLYCLLNGKPHNMCLPCLETQPQLAHFN